MCWNCTRFRARDDWIWMWLLWRQIRFILKNTHKIHSVFVCVCVCMCLTLLFVVFFAVKTFPAIPILLWHTKGNTMHCTYSTVLYNIRLPGVFASTLLRLGQGSVQWKITHLLLEDFNMSSETLEFKNTSEETSTICPSWLIHKTAREKLL